MKWLAIGLVGCGRLGFDALESEVPVPDAAVDAAPPCTFGPWQAPKPVTALSTPAQDFGGSVTADGLAFYYTSNYRVQVSRRADRSAAWPAPVEEPTLNGAGGQLEVILTHDGLEAYLAGDNGGGMCLYHASRSSAAAPFSTPVRLDALCQAHPAGGPWPSVDGLRLYYSTFETGPLGRILVSERASTSEAFGPGVPVEGLGATLDRGYPFLTPDELTLYWEGGSDGPHALHETHRASTTEAWGPSVEIAGVEDNNDNEDVSLTADGREIYFSSRRAPNLGELDIWRATRSCE